MAYRDEEAALTDVLRLSRGMSLKNALAGLPRGGGKAVILADPADKTPEMMEAFGRAVERLNGAYVTAEDVGSDVADMDAVRRATRHVMGTSDAEGDPSAHTARGVFLCLERAAQRRLGRGVSGLRVAVKGVGHVGWQLCRLLHEAGARLTVADPRREAARRAAADFGAELADPKEILIAEADVLAPCALGGDLTPELAERLRARVVCGAANNQLASPEADWTLRDRSILYCPDYLVNAGGIIAVGRSAAGWSASTAAAAIEALPDTLDAILDRAEAEGAPPGEVADREARARLERAAG
jgi:leucine dehydrogenase